MLRRRLQVVAQIALIAALLWSSSTLFAQNPPAPGDHPSSRELEQPDFLPEEPPGVFELPPVVEPQPEISTEPADLQVDAYVFEGNHVVSTETLQKIAAPYAARKVSRAELEQLRQAISRYYVEQGYINSGALLPDDFYRDRVVHYRIVEGRVSEIRTRGMERLHDTYLRQRLLHGDEPLNVNELQERFQLLLTDPLFAKVNVRLEPAADPGAAILDVDVTRARPWDFSVYYNNYQPPSVGSEAFGFAGVVRNLTGFGDALDFTCQQGLQGIDKGGRCGVGIQAPIYYRTDIHARYDYGQSSVIEEPINALDVNSRIESYELGLSHALIDDVKQRFALGLTYANRENKTNLLGQPFEFATGSPNGISKVQAWRFEQDFVRRWENQAIALRSTFTKGRTDVPPGAAQAKDYFFWLGQAQLTRRLLDNGASLFLRGTLQWTQNRLVPLEQISIGGVSSVRGYRENQLVRDQGYFVNLEFRYPLFDRDGGRHRLFLIPFFDFGEAWNTGDKHEQLSSVGLGLNWQLSGLLVDFYYGKRLIEPEVQTSGNLQDDGIHFQVRYNF